MKTTAPASDILAQIDSRATSIATGQAGLYTSAELCKLLNVTKQTVSAWAAKGTIPYLRLGTLLRFDPTALSVWLQARTVR